MITRPGETMKQPVERRLAAILAARRAGLFGGSFIPNAAVLDRQLGDQTALGGDGVAVAVPQWEVSVAQLEHGDIGVGAGTDAMVTALPSCESRSSAIIFRRVR